MARSDAIARSDNTELPNGPSYRVEVLGDGKECAPPDQPCRCCLRTIEDTNVAIAPMLTFNGRDSNNVCRQHSVEMP